MRRLLTFAAFLLVISAVPVCAQRGGHPSGGGRGGFTGGRGGFSGGHGGFSGGHAAIGGHAFVGHGSGGPGFAGSHFASQYRGPHFGNRPPSFDRGDHFRRRGDHFRRGRFGRYGYWNSCIGCWGYGYPYYSYYAGIDPYWWWDTYSSYDEDDARERARAGQMNAENLEEQQRLRAEDQDVYARPAQPRGRQASADERAESDPTTVLVFRDQRRREVHNYAIVGQMLWSFTPQRTEKIPLSELDIPATEKANDERGVEFRIPGVSEGQ